MTTFTSKNKMQTMCTPCHPKTSITPNKKSQKILVYAFAKSSLNNTTLLFHLLGPIQWFFLKDNILQHIAKR
jgi:hypothetical protein